MGSKYIVKIESYEGDDTFLNCGDDTQDFLFCVVSGEADGHAEIIDNGYRTYEEASKAWPQTSSDGQ